MKYSLIKFCIERVWKFFDKIYDIIDSLIKCNEILNVSVFVMSFLKVDMLKMNK